MTVEFIFYVFGLILIVASIAVVTAKNPVHAALCLVLTFFTASVLWLLMEAEFLAISLVLVYVGAVMVLFLFVVMMLDINFEQLRKGFWDYAPTAGVVAFIMASELALIFSVKKTGLNSFVSVASSPSEHSNVHKLGMLMYSEYIVPFELAAIVLLVAMVAAIGLTLRRRKTTKYVDPALQVMVKAVDRLRMVSIPPVCKNEMSQHPERGESK